MKALLLSTILAVSALSASAHAGLVIDATNGPIKITVSDR